MKKGNEKCVWYNVSVDFSLLFLNFLIGLLMLGWLRLSQEKCAC